MTTPSVQTTTARFGRMEHRGILLGLGAAQLAVLTIAMVIAVAGVYSAGTSGLVAGAGLWVPLAVAATASVRGRPVIQWLPLIGHWRARRLLGQTTAVTSTRPLPDPGVLRIPGIAGQLTVTEAPTSGAALIHDRRTGVVCAVLRVSGAGFVLQDPTAQNGQVASWGRVLGSLCQQSAIVRLQVLHRSLPSGGSVRGWWANNAMAGAPWAARVLADLVADAESTSDHQQTLLAVALRPPRGRGQILGPAGVATIQQHLGALIDALKAAELHVDGWVTPDRLGSVLRASYDPDGAARAGDLGGTGSLLGPMGFSEHWDHVRTDSAVHAVYWITQWPRSDVHPAFLQPLLLAPGTRRTFTLIAEPLPTAKALREIRRTKAEHAADAAQRARIGQVQDEAARAEDAELARREQDLIAGHGDLRFTGLVTVTATNTDDLAAACAATEAAAAQAMCEIRRLVGQQGQAHATGALPLARGLE